MFELAKEQTTTEGFNLTQTIAPVYLSDLSPKDKRWDKRRSEVDGFRGLLRKTIYHSYSVRLADCSCQLIFASVADENGNCSLKLQAARFCRVRLCPVCQWRRSLMWAAKTIQVLPKILEAHPKSRFLMLTLTVRNCELSDLRSQLGEMHHAWTKLVKRKEWKVQGWVRSTEVKRRDGDLAGPHYHCLLMVKPGYFGNDYLTQERWVALWQDCLGVNYTPVVDVRTIKPKPGGTGQRGEDVIAALSEVIKYTTKPEDILRGNNCQVPGEPVRMTDSEWLVGLIMQVYGTKGIATGGAIKYFFKHLENEPRDLIHAEDDESQSNENAPRMAMNWREVLKRYRANLDSQDE